MRMDVRLCEAIRYVKDEDAEVTWQETYGSVKTVMTLMLSEMISDAWIVGVMDNIRRSVT